MIARRALLLALLALAVPDGADAQRRRRSGRSARSRSPGSAAVFASSAGGSFRSCAEARAAGAAPLRVGQKGYSTRLDRDRDGVACE